MGLFLLFAFLALIHYWYLFVGGVVLLVGIAWLLDAWSEHRASQAREAAERRCHEQARRQIKQIAVLATTAMADIARQAKHDDPPGSAVEVRPR